MRICRNGVYLKRHGLLDLDQKMTAEKLKRTTYAKAGDRLMKVMRKSEKDNPFGKEKAVEQGTVVKDYGYYLLLRDQKGMIFTIHKTDFLLKDDYEIKKITR